MNIYNIPAHCAFLQTLAAGIIRQAAETGFTLGDFTVLLPNRRSCRNLQHEFLRQTGGKPLLLPRISPIGDVDEEELSLLGASDEALPQAIAPLHRQSMLTRIITQWYAQNGNRDVSFNQAWSMADALGGWIDQVHIEQLDFNHIEKLVPENFSMHWQDVAGFLSIFAKQWQPALSQSGMIDASERRIRLLQIQTQFWQDNPPEKPLIAAGSTGSIPATARLLKTISNLENGAVLLPGLDTGLDQESFNKIDICHPQFFFKKTDRYYRNRPQIHQMLEIRRSANFPGRLCNRKNMDGGFPPGANNFSVAKGGDKPGINQEFTYRKLLQYRRRSRFNRGDDARDIGNAWKNRRACHAGQGFGAPRDFTIAQMEYRYRRFRRRHDGPNPYWPVFFDAGANNCGKI